MCVKPWNDAANDIASTAAQHPGAVVHTIAYRCRQVGHPLLCPWTDGWVVIQRAADGGDGQAKPVCQVIDRYVFWSGQAAKLRNRRLEECYFFAIPWYKSFN